MRLWKGFLVFTLLGVCAGVEISKLEQGDLEIVGYGDDCDDRGSLCDSKIGLVCSPVGRCECDITRDLYFVPATNRCDKMTDEDEEDETPDQPSAESEESKEDNSVETDEREVNKPSVSKSVSPAEASKPVVAGKEDREEESYIGEEKQDPVDWSDASNEDSVWNLPEKCSTDEDCQSSSSGKYSRCNTIRQTCECYDTDNKGKDVTLVNGKCMQEKEIGESCEIHEECMAFIRGDAICHFDMERNTKYCTCGAFSLWDDDLQECLPLGTNGTDSLCKRDYQCSDEKALGRLSTCSKETGRCECTNVLIDSSTNVMFYQRMCVAEKELGEDCEISQECEASLGMNSFCDSESFTCLCKPGASCPQMLFGQFSYEQPQVSAFTLVTLGFLGIAVMMAGMFCIVNYLRKEETYSYVRQHNEGV